MALTEIYEYCEASSSYSTSIQGILLITLCQTKFEIYCTDIRVFVVQYLYYIELTILPTVLVGSTVLVGTYCTVGSTNKLRMVFLLNTRMYVRLRVVQYNAVHTRIMHVRISTTKYNCTYSYM